MAVSRNVARAVIVGIASVAVLGVVSASLAHKGATGIVMKRMMAMKDMADGTKALALMVTGKQPYDAGSVEAIAVRLKQHADEIPTLFPKGSIEGPSEATPNIWSNWAAFKGEAEALGKLATELQAAAAGGKAAAMASFVKIGKSCSRCHQDFRKKKN